MTFEDWLGDRIEIMSSHEYAAEKAAWEVAYKIGFDEGELVGFEKGVDYADKRGG